MGMVPTSVTTTRAPLSILTSLRFFAAVEVVVYHGVYSDGKFQDANIFLRDLTSAGFQAVTFFFVLSGFILTYVYFDRSENGYLNTSACEFWKARFARIFPVYFLGLLVALPQFIYYALIKKIIATPDFIIGLTLNPILQQAWWPRVATAWNAPAWSLSVEFFFYACFPMLTLAVARLSRNYFFLLAYGLVIAVGVLRFVISSPGSVVGSPEWNFDNFFPLFHLPQFIFGMALGRFFLFGPTISPKIHAVMLGLGAIGLLVVFGGRSLLPAWTRTDPALVVLFGLVIFGGARAEYSFKALVFPFLILLGEASYSIYILHMSLGLWWVNLTRGLSLPAILSFVAYFVLIIVVSILSYRYVEKPMRHWILGHREHRPA
jgi:peptidoglycan/LPS O-acetylase OafA/YrhL